MLRGTAQGLPIHYLWPPGLGLHAEIAVEPVDDDLQVELTHARQDGLTGFRVFAHAKGGILPLELFQRRRQLVPVFDSPGFHRH